MTTPKTIIREELYEKVWSLPTSRLKDELGISDVAIAKICKKLNVPKPPRGYWNKLQHGQTLKRIPLPAQGSVPAQTTIHADIFGHPRPTSPMHKQRPITPATAFAPTKVEDYPLVKKTHQALLKGRTDSYGRVRPAENGCLNINVSKAKIDQALNVFNALIRGFEAQGHALVVTHRLDYKGQPVGELITAAVVDGENVEFSMEEPSSRAERKPTKEEERRGYFYDRWIYTPSGTLRFVLYYPFDNLQTKWTIREDRPLAEILSSFTDGLIAASKQLKAGRLKDERRQAEWKAQAEKEAKAVERLQKLKQCAATWEEVSRYRRFVEALETGAVKRAGADVNPESNLGRWLAWAKSYIDSQDPVEQVLAHELGNKREPAAR